MSDVEKIDVARHWVSENKIQLNTLHKVPEKEIFYNCDSILFRKEKIDDTLIIWSPGSEWMHDLTDKYGRKNLLAFINNKSFGVANYVKKIHSDGRIETTSLTKHVFLAKGDSLFEEVEYYTVSEELLDPMYKSWTNLFLKTSKDSLESVLLKQQADSIKTEIDKYKKNKFRLLFHCSMFKNGKRKYFTSGSSKKCDDVIILENFLKKDNKEYYEVRINNDCSENPTSYAFGFDNDFRFIYWEGCFTDELAKAEAAAKKASPSCK